MQPENVSREADNHNISVHHEPTLIFVKVLQAGDAVPTDYLKNHAEASTHGQRELNGGDLAGT